MIKLKNILNEIEYDDGTPVNRVGGFKYTWQHHHSIPFQTGKLVVVDTDEYPSGDGVWIYYVYEGGSPFEITPSRNDGDGDFKSGSLIDKIKSMFKPTVSKTQSIKPVISVITDNHYSEKHNRTVPTSIEIHVGKDASKDWALPSRVDRDKWWRGDVAVHTHKNQIVVYDDWNLTSKYVKSDKFVGEITDAQKKFISDLIKAVWEQADVGLTNGKWVIRKVEYEYDDYDGEDVPAAPMSNKYTGDEIGDTDPRYTNNFWNMKTGEWGTLKDATKFSDKAIRSIESQRYVIKTKDKWEAVLVSDVDITESADDDVDYTEYQVEGFMIAGDTIIELHFVRDTGTKSLIGEAEYRGRKVKLGKPFRTPNGPKKFSVYVKNPKGNVVKVNFGHKGSGGQKTMKIKKSNAERRKSFRARHRCHSPGPRHKARYWSCRFGWPKSGKGSIDKT